MTAKEQGLPELPMAVAVVTPSKYLAWLAAWLSSKNWEPTPDGTHLYTADQMRAYALAALASDTGERGVGVAEVMARHDAEAVRCNFKRCGCDYCIALRAQPAGGGEVGYSLDADPRGIRAATADAITGALAFGAQGNNPPPAGHWLLPFWKAARADASGWLAVLDLLRTDRNGKKWNCIASRAGSWVDVSPYFEPQPIASPDGADAFAYGASAPDQPDGVGK